MHYADLAPWQLHRALLGPEQLTRLSAQLDAALALARLARPRNPDFVATSSSLRLRSVPGFDIADVVGRLPQSVVLALHTALGPHIACCSSQCWLRRQYPSALAPPLHHAHAWHQDGALGYAFQNPPDAGADAATLLPLQTLWIALNACGLDAPGLEFAAWQPQHLLGLDELRALPLAAAPSGSAHCPRLNAGDALLFGGAQVHRSHVDAAMTELRTSIELRFLPQSACTGRLRGEDWLFLGP